MTTRAAAIFLILVSVGCADSDSGRRPEETVTDEEAELQAEIDALGASLDSMRAEVDEGFRETEAMRNRLERDQREGDSLRERIEADQREIDAIIGQ